MPGHLDRLEWLQSQAYAAIGMFWIAGERSEMPFLDQALRDLGMPELARVLDVIRMLKSDDAFGPPGAHEAAVAALKTPAPFPTDAEAPLFWLRYWGMPTEVAKALLERVKVGALEACSVRPQDDRFEVLKMGMLAEDSRMGAYLDIYEAWAALPKAVAYVAPRVLFSPLEVSLAIELARCGMLVCPADTVPPGPWFGIPEGEAGQPVVMLRYPFEDLDVVAPMFVKVPKRSGGIVLECGPFEADERTSAAVDRDRVGDAEIEARGFRVLRFHRGQIRNSIAACAEAVKEAIGGLEPLPLAAWSAPLT